MVSVGFDYTLFIQMFMFLIIVAIVNFFVAKPLRNTMLGRSSKISSLMQRAKASLDAIEAKKAEYGAQLKAVKAEIAEYHNQLKSEAEQRTQAMLDKIKKETNEELEKARASIATEITAARDSLRGDIGALSQQIIQAVKN